LTRAASAARGTEPRAPLSKARRDAGSACACIRPAGRPEECFDGRLPPWHIKQGLAANRGRIVHCYETALRRDRSLGGRVVFGFTVGDDGVVGDVQVESNDTADDALATCIGDVLTEVRFLCSVGSVRVHYPVELESWPADPP
jgi:hypothetical protein